MNVVIANQAEARSSRVHGHVSGSSTDGVRIIRHEEVIDMPPRRLISRSRHFSGLSDVIDLKDLDRPRYYTRRRSSSRVRYVDELEIPRRRSRVRSASRVSIVDDTDEPVIISKSRRRLSRRRRHVHLDGPADTYQSETRSRGRSRRSSHEPGRVSSSGGGVKLVENEVIPHKRPVLNAIEPPRGAELVSETFSSGSPIRQGSVFTATRSSDHRPRATVESVSRSRSTHCFEDSGQLSDHHRSPSIAPRSRSRGPSQANAFEEPPAPPRKRRHRYRGSMDILDSDSDDSPREPPFTYRNVHAPLQRSPRSHPHILADRLANAHLTPPGEEDTFAWPGQNPATYIPDSPPHSTGTYTPLSLANFYAVRMENGAADYAHFGAHHDW